MKKLLSILLAVCLLVTALCVAMPGAGVSAASQYADSTVEGGVILHAMNWSYNTIRENLDDIYSAGYTTVQTSCIQPPKDFGYYWTDMTGQWWKFYQPIDICVADGNTWLGTKAELTALCAAAHEKGMRIISDIVVNHMGSTDSGTGRSYQINPVLRDDESCWHNQNKTATGDNHYEMTQYDLLDKPDLNSSNKTVQNMVIALLKDAVDCGVDGFRFDAAQNIEVPFEEGYGSDFWSTVMPAVNAYAGRTIFSYGETYYDVWGTIDSYIQYIGHVSEPIIGCEALVAAKNGDAATVANHQYQNYRDAKYNVVWVESHDSYFYGTGTERYGRTNTQDIDDEDVVKAWAIVGSRADSTSLFFARPNSTMRLASSDTTWKSDAVAEVNKFKNYFKGQSEYLSSSGKIAYNERGTSGVVISKLDGAGSVSLTANRMASGTYYDQITGNPFTVSNGKIRGTVGSTGVAVVYNAPGAETPTEPGSAEPTVVSDGVQLTLKTGVWNNDSAWFAAYFFGGKEAQWAKMTGSGDTFTVTAPEGYRSVIFCRMDKHDTSTLDWSNKWNQTDNLTIPSSNATYTITGWGSGTDVCPGAWSIDPTEPPATDPPTDEPTEEPTEAPTEAPTQAPTEEPTEAPATYLLGDADGNGIVNIIDATVLQRVLVNYTYADADLMRIRGAITNPAKGLNILDATAIQRYLASYANVYGVGSVRTYPA